MQEIEAEGKDVQQAVEKGLKALGLRRDQVEVAIKDEGSAGFLGLGARPARVIIRERKWVGEESKQPPSERRDERAERPPRPRDDRGPRPERREGRDRRQERRPDTRERRREERRPRPAPQPQGAPAPQAQAQQAPRPDRNQPPADPEAAVREAKGLLEELMKLMGLQLNGVRASWDPAQIRVKAELDTPDGQVLVGKDGRTLEALQFLSTVLTSRRVKTPVAVQVDTGGYWQSREEKILTQIRQAADDVERSQRPFRLDPMDAPTRRLVHKALAEHPGVETASEGEGPWRKVVIRPKTK